MKCYPIKLQSVDGNAEYLNRIEVKTRDDKDESWLQNLIHKNPKVLPVAEFDNSFAPLIPLGREIGTNSGYIDNLYVSPMGKLVIVETKLWKNPEKHRTVVAQIIDYAKELSNWSYDDLDNAILKVSQEKIDRIVEDQLNNNDMSLEDFQELLINNLKAGEFLLLIVGDKISANVALLAEAIQGTPGLNFSIGLIELQIHQLNSNEDWPILVIPDIVGKTVEVTRGVIKVQYEKEEPKIEIAISSDEPTVESKGKINQEIFLQKLPERIKHIYQRWLDTWATVINTTVYWGTSGFSYRIMKNGKLETIFIGYGEWGLSLIRQKEKELVEATNEQYQKYLDVIYDIPKAANILSSGKQYIKNEDISIDELQIILQATHDFAEEVKDK